LGGRKFIQSVKTEWWGAGMVICLERGADLHMAQLMPLPLTGASEVTTLWRYTNLLIIIIILLLLIIIIIIIA